MRTPKITLVASNLLLLLPIVVGVLFWDQIPERIPVHFNLNGEADGWGGKFFAFVGVPLMILPFQLLIQGVILFSFSLQRKADPRMKELNPAIAKLILWAIPTSFLIGMTPLYRSALGRCVNTGRLILPMLVGATFMIVGICLPHCRPNHVIGIRLPWTLADEDNWNYTHRLGGWSWTIGGFLLMLLTAKGWRAASIPVGVVTLFLIPVVASYRHSRRVRNR
ncbi:MAG: SdpI family protein [Kiritimatiellia bacterium]